MQDSTSAPDTLSRVLALLAELVAEGKPFAATVEHGGMAASLTARQLGEASMAALVMASNRSALENSKEGALGRNGETIESRKVSNMEPPMNAWNPAWLALTPTEKAVIRVFQDAPSPTEWKTKQAIAGDAGVPFNRDFEALLRFMVEHRILESQNGRGYRLKNPPREKPGEAPDPPPRPAPKPRQPRDSTTGEDFASLIGAFQRLQDKPCSLGEIVGDFPPRDAAAVKAAVQKMVETGQLIRANGLYRLPPAPE